MAIKCPECDRVEKTIGGIHLHMMNQHGFRAVEVLQMIADGKLQHKEDKTHTKCASEQYSNEESE